MKISYRLIYLLFSLLPISLFLSDCSTEKRSEGHLPNQEIEVLKARLNEFNIAFNQGDLDALENMVTKNYLHTNGNSKPIRKANWFKYLEKRKKELESGELKIEDYRMEETEMEIYDDMAIVSAKISFSSIKSGDKKVNEFRVTNIWVKEENNWKRAGFHDTRIR